MSTPTETSVEITVDAARGTEQRWVAFGESGAAGSILHTRIGYAVRMLNDDSARGIYPTLEVAKSALHAAMAPGSDWPDFREH